MPELGRLPVAFAALGAARYLHKAGRTVESHDLLTNASRASYLLAVLAVHKMLERKETVVGARGSGVECSLVIFGDVFLLSVVIVAKFCLVGTRTLYVREGEWESHCKSYISINCTGIRCRDAVWDWSSKTSLAR